MRKIYIRYWSLFFVVFLFYAGFTFIFGNFRIIFEEFQFHYYLLETATGFFGRMLLFHTVVVFIYWYWHERNAATGMNVISHIFLLCLPIVVFYVAIVFFVNPQMELTKIRYESTTEYLDDLVQRAEQAVEEGRNQYAMRLLQQYMGLTEYNEPIEKLFLQAQLQDAESRNQQYIDEESTALTTQLREQHAAELYAVAERYYLEDDYVSSFYYAGAATLLSNPPRDDAIQLQRDARALIQEGVLLQEETAARRLFFRRSEGIQALIAGEMDPDQSLKAYRLLRALTSEYPDDSEIAIRFQESLEQISTRTFFLSQAIIDENRPGFYNAWFIDEQESQYLVFFARHVSYSRQFSYAFDVEILGIDKDSFQPVLQVRANIAQVIDNVVNFRGIDIEGTLQSVQVLTGNSAPLTVAFSQSIIDTVSKNRIQQSWKTVGLLEFFRVLQAGGRYTQQYMFSYLIAQGMTLFLFIIVTIWVGIIVIRYTATLRKPEWYSWLFVPVLLWITGLVQAIIIQGVDLLSIALYRMIGLIGALSTVAALIVLLLVIGMIRIQQSISAENPA